MSIDESDSSSSSNKANSKPVPSQISLFDGPGGLPSTASTSSAGGAPSNKNKMYQCPVCPKSFPRSSGLETHMNSHSGARRMSIVSSLIYWPVTKNQNCSLQVSATRLRQSICSPFKCQAPLQNSWILCFRCRAPRATIDDQRRLQRPSYHTQL
jgi:uncharacterized Zn-finger protein